MKKREKYELVATYTEGKFPCIGTWSCDECPKKLDKACEADDADDNEQFTARVQVAKDWLARHEKE
jgi:hypothetical protein